ncbi:uncharacterized protein LOC127241945 [Andrographis paniculata]|uniref:uncharacterized protein LOC127241945 n=1 Tax=Andrographis paniculata TaxID=175694 RepID=UPI0021E88AAD|nr:uncharacterized protein LOC127241945 [Andrographis paniculata]
MDWRHLGLGEGWTAGSSSSSSSSPSSGAGAGADWGPVAVAVAMFILLSPGLLFQIPARSRFIEFGNLCTSAISILVHALLYLAVYTILVIAVGVHIHFR